MEGKTAKYLHKRRQLIEIITSVPVGYQRGEDGILYECTTTVGFWDARIMAEKILAKMGINKPTEVSEQESAGIAIG